MDDVKRPLATCRIDHFASRNVTKIFVRSGTNQMHKDISWKWSSPAFDVFAAKDLFRKFCGGKLVEYVYCKIFTLCSSELLFCKFFMVTLLAVTKKYCSPFFKPKFHGYGKVLSIKAVFRYYIIAKCVETSKYCLKLYHEMTSINQLPL